MRAALALLLVIGGCSKKKPGDEQAEPAPESPAPESTAAGRFVVTPADARIAERLEAYYAEPLQACHAGPVGVDLTLRLEVGTNGRVVRSELVSGPAEMRACVEDKAARFRFHPRTRRTSYEVSIRL